MATFTLYYDMVISGTVFIEADNLEAAMLQMNQIPKSEFVKGLDNSTADPVVEGFQLHDEAGEPVF